MSKHLQFARIASAVAALVCASLILHRDDVARLLARGDNAFSTSLDDRAGLFSDAQRSAVEQYHAAMRAAHDIDYRVLTQHDGEDINWAAHEYFEAADIGERSASGRGLLLLIDTASDLVRLEVSSSLEAVYPDAFVAYLQNRQMVPFFQTGRVADGILATTELIVARAQQAEAGSAFAPPTRPTSIGGGATATSRIGSNGSTGKGELAPVLEAARPAFDFEPSRLGPLQVVDGYLRAMADRDGRPDLPFYSAETVRMLESWVVTPAQMDNIARTYRSCTVEDVRARDELAVVRYGVEARECAPWFLRREEGAWKLDLVMMSSSVRFNHDNHWRFDTRSSHPFAFAFADWRFDRSGFPRPRDEN